VVSDNAGSFAVQRRTGKTLAVSQNNELRATLVAKTENTDRRESSVVNVARRYWSLNNAPMPNCTGNEVGQTDSGNFFLLYEKPTAARR